ncbi:hypothetical protein RvY_14853 [Ramazzottius varieornatus]|uniref:DNA-directed DNA polymerase n=1 Tax=Ramazzottius varieornatus TaxID=947166 RepID=A0A1D1W133_RAMVA|nr:hypothetical protein RvY_14853 [Ramazzottius varieornatus]
MSRCVDLEPNPKRKILVCIVTTSARYGAHELRAAVDHGYTVFKVREVYHWEEVKERLFRPYIDLFYKIKTEASGYPDDGDTDEKKVQYVRDFEEHKGITLKADNIVSNPGLRTLAKLHLNSFWGRFGMQENRANTEFFTEPGKFWQRMLSGESTVTSRGLINDNTVQLSYKSADGFAEPNATVNVVVAAFTTCYARLLPLKYMD